MCKYLENEYFKAFNFKFSHKIYFDTYKGFIDNVKKICDNVKCMFSDEMLEAIAEAEEIMKNPDNYPSYNSVEELMEALNEE